jgi:monoamine oxidase
MIKRRQLIKWGASALPLSSALALYGCGSERAKAVDVAVIGAGLAGLQAALMLEQSGLKVQVLEASDRIGGRLYTLDQVRGRPEAGGNLVVTNYARFMDLATRLKVPLESLPDRAPEDRGQVFCLDGQLIKPQQWPESPLNPFPAEFRQLTPDRALSRLIGRHPYSAQNQWKDPHFWSIDQAVTDKLKPLGLNSKALQLLNANNGYGNQLDQTSLLHLYHVQANLINAMGAGAQVQRVVGGNQRMPEAMAAALNTPVLTRHQVSAVELEQGVYQIACADGSSLSAHRVVMALPSSAARTIQFSPRLPEPQLQALQNLQYHKVFQAHIVFDRPFWREDNLPPQVWSDGIIGRLLPSTNSGGEVSSLTVWVNGDSADALDAMEPAQVEQRIIEELERIYPSSRAQLRVAALHSWQQQPGYSGAYATWRPGDIQAITPVLQQPVGAIHWAGEHTADSMRGMEGALESGERVAFEIMNSITG